MVYEVITDNGITSLEQYLTYVARVVPQFFPLTLFAIWTAITLTTHFTTKRLSGRSNFSSSFVVGGFVTTIVAALLSTIPGVINLATMVTCVALFMIGLIWLFLTNER